MKPKKITGADIRRARFESGMPSTELARKLGKSNSWLSFLEHGKGHNKYVEYINQPHIKKKLFEWFPKLALPTDKERYMKLARLARLLILEFDENGVNKSFLQMLEDLRKQLGIAEVSGNTNQEEEDM